MLVVLYFYCKYGNQNGYERKDIRHKKIQPVGMKKNYLKAGKKENMASLRYYKKDINKSDNR